MPQASSCCVIVRVEIIASRSVSNGFNSLWAVAGVDKSEDRRYPISREGAREPVGDGANVPALVVVVVVDVVLSDKWVMVVTVSVAPFSSVVDAISVCRALGLADGDRVIYVAGVKYDVCGSCDGRCGCIHEDGV